MQFKAEGYNPFTSSSYVEKWSKICESTKKVHEFKSISPVRFIKTRIPLTYINVGKNLVNGIYYQINSNENDYRNKVFFLRDIPSYFSLNKKNSGNNLKLRSVPQYKGLLADIRNFDSVTSYLRTRVSANRLRYYRKCKRRLEHSFQIKYEYNYGVITKKHHDTIIETYHMLMNKRYQEKGEQLIGGSQQSDAFFKELSYELVNDKKAIFIIIYDADNPICISFSYVLAKVVIASRIVFDTDYKKFGLGHIEIKKLLEWSFEKGKKIVDFSKLEYPYKHKWCNYVYKFEFHFWYDSNSIKATLVSWVLASMYRFVQELRERNWHHRFHKLKTFIKKTPNIESEVSVKINYLPVEKAIPSSYTEVPLHEYYSGYLKRLVNDFLYKYVLNLDEIVLYRSLENSDQFLLKKKNSVLENTRVTI